MIRYDGCFDFSCPPRTGTAWVLGACQLAGLGPGFRHQAHVPFPVREHHDTLRVTLVRHPCDWLASCYAVIKRGSMDTNHLGAFEGLGRSCFDDFVRAYCYNMEGGIGKLFHIYIQGADSCLRIEDMPWALLELLESCGVPEDARKRFATLGKQNVSPSLPTWDNKLRKRVLEAEGEIVEHFDYY